VSAYKILIYGYGNPGRQDDGLGNAFIDSLETWAKHQKVEGLTFDSNYQLNIEDAAEVSDKDLVIFVDASTEDIEDFILTPVNASTKVAFTTHAASPGYIIDLCKQLYNRVPATYLMHIKGYEWEFREGLTEKALQNLEKAMKHIKMKLKEPEKMIEAFQAF